MFLISLLISSVMEIGLNPNPNSAGKAIPIHVSSSAFSEGESIPEKYTCDGQNISPPLKWNGVPEKTKSIALICEDPDAPSGIFTHWVLYDLPGTTTELVEGSSGQGKEGVNGFGKNGYGGPCPPPGGAHRYFFRVYALDTESLGNTGSLKEDLTTAMQGHILAQGQLMGRYKRTK